jgi:hypothetical protein
LAEGNLWGGSQKIKKTSPSSLRRIEIGVYIEVGSIATKAFTDFSLSYSRFSTMPPLPGGGHFLFDNGEGTYGKEDRRATSGPRTLSHGTGRY